MEEITGKTINHIITGILSLASGIFFFFLNSLNNRLDKIESSVVGKANKEDVQRDNDRLFETLVRIETRLNDLHKGLK